MSSIVKQKVGDKIYLYESTSYRNEGGQPRNKRKIVGKIDPVTGQSVYKPEYLERMATEGHPVLNAQIESSFTIKDIYQSSIRDFGAFYLYQKLTEQMGLMGVL